jgi:hypothetical protein
MPDQKEMRGEESSSGVSAPRRRCAAEAIADPGFPRKGCFRSAIDRDVLIDEAAWNDPE